MHISDANATTAEEAVMLTLMTFGRRLKTRLAGDAIDPVFLPLLHTLRCSGPTRLNDLAAAAQLDASTVSRHVRQLEDQGFITRTEHPDDGRARLVQVSELGDRCLDVTFEHRRALIGDALADWSPGDREQLRAVLNRLTHSLNAPTQRPTEVTT